MERSNQTLSRLRQLIQKRDFDAGRMPPERVLAEELGVGRRSLRRALDVLEQEGRISRHQGRGTFVNNGLNGEPADRALAERGGATVLSRPCWRKPRFRRPPTWPCRTYSSRRIPSKSSRCGSRSSP